jgi:hypothetical protein
LPVGEQATLTATVSPSNAAITWTSSAPNIAAVDNGTVTAKAEGTATITAKAGGKTATCTITVEKDLVVASGEVGTILWKLTENGTLTISGTGAIPNRPPWNPNSSGDNRIKTVIINNGITSIGDRAFENCTALRNVTMGNEVTSIGESAFDGCSGLTSIIIPNSVTSIGGDAFWSCSGLTSIIIPNSVTNLGYWAFERCSGLTNVTIGSGITFIGSRTFYDCNNLKSVTVMATNPTNLENTGFEQRVFNTLIDTLYVPKGRVNTYKGSVWSIASKTILEQP